MVVGETKGIHHQQERNNSVDIYLLICLSLYVPAQWVNSGRISNRLPKTSQT